QEERLQVRRADRRLALEEHLDIDGQTAGRVQHRLGGLDVDEQLPLVIACATSVQLTVADLRLKRRAVPQVDGVDGLHVVVPVDEHGRRVRTCAHPLTVHNRMRSEEYTSELQSRE